MPTVKANKGTMTSRERVEYALHRAIPDRVPVDYQAGPIIHKKLAAHLGFDESENEMVLQALGVDVRSIRTPYIGPMLFEQPPDRRVDPVYGYIMRWVPNRFGGYWDYCDFPLLNADDEKIEAFPVPNPDDFDYDKAVDTAISYSKENYALYIGASGYADIINATGRIMGMEETLMNLYTNDAATLSYIDRRTDMEIGIFERLLSRISDKISFVWMGEDLGTQRAPMISMELYRRVFRPRHQRYIDLAKSYGKPVMFHTCGSSSWVYNDFIEMGVSAVDTLQPEAANMSPQYLKQQFGDHLAFHGCISTAGPLAYGTAEQTRNTVRETLEIMMPNGGYLLAPTHLIQDNTPVENILAMYEEAHTSGVYSC